MVCRVLQEERTVDGLDLIILCNTETSSAYVCVCVCLHMCVYDQVDSCDTG